MVENSAVGLAMLGSEVAVTVIGEDRHQAVLARYRPGATVAVELGWCTIRTGKYRGQRGIEVLLDGRRVGELTHLMSQRYGSVVSGVMDNGDRPGCEAQIHTGERGVEITLRLPKNPDALFPAVSSSGEPRTAVLMPVGQERRKGSSRPWWIAAAVFVLLVFGIIGANSEDETPSTAGNVSAATPTTTEPATAEPTTTTTPPPTTTTTTTTPPPKPPPAPKPAPKPEPPAPPPPPPAPASDCDPNYSGCVPIASDVDCAGGSGNGPAYADGPVEVIGADIYELDRDGDGTACDS